VCLHKRRQHFDDDASLKIGVGVILGIRHCACRWLRVRPDGRAASVRISNGWRRAVLSGIGTPAFDLLATTSIRGAPPAPRLGYLQAVTSGCFGRSLRMLRILRGYLLPLFPATEPIAGAAIPARRRGMPIGVCS
jgi:hypothetical protein